MAKTTKNTAASGSYAKGLGRRIGSAALAAVMAMSFAAPATAFAAGDDDEATTDSDAAELVRTSEDGNTNTWQVLDEVKQGSVEIEMASVAENVTVDLPVKISGLKGGETFTWDAFNPQGNLASGNYVRVWAANEQLSVTIGGITVNGGSDTTNAYYTLNGDGSGFANANSGKMSVTMPNLPAAIAGVAKGTQKYNLQIVSEMEATNSTDNTTNNGGSTGDSSTLTPATKTDSDVFEIYMNGEKLTADEDGWSSISMKEGETATFTVYKNGVLSNDAYSWLGGAGTSSDTAEITDGNFVDGYHYGSSAKIKAISNHSDTRLISFSVFVPGDTNAEVCGVEIDVTD